MKHLLGENRVYSLETLHAQFLVRVFGVIAGTLLIQVSDFKTHMGIFYVIAVTYTLYTFVVRYHPIFIKSRTLQRFNLFVDVWVISYLIVIRGGLRSDFFLGYYLILGYVLLLRDRKLLFYVSLTSVLAFTFVSIFFTPEADFQWSRLIIRQVLMIGTMYLLQNYSNLLAEESTLKHKAINKALKDPLTGVYNRYILEHAEEWDAQKSWGLYMAMIDIDHFKEINDTYGHAFGDEVLKRLGSLMTDHLPHDDLVIRFGGEEFLIIMEHETFEEAKALIEDLRLSFEKTVFRHNDQTVSLTFSAGLVSIDKEKPLNQAIEKADQAMYQAKRKGRNLMVAKE